MTKRAAEQLLTELEPDAKKGRLTVDKLATLLAHARGQTGIAIMPILLPELRNIIIGQVSPVTISQYRRTGATAYAEAEQLFEAMCAHDFRSPITGAPLALYSNALQFANSRTPGRTFADLYLYCNQRCRITLTHLVRCVLSRTTPTVQLCDAAGNETDNNTRTPTYDYDPWMVPIPINEPTRLYGSYLWGDGSPHGGLVFLGGLAMISTTTTHSTDEDRQHAKLRVGPTAVWDTDHVLVQFRPVAGFVVRPSTVRISTAGDHRLDTTFPSTVVTIASLTSGATAIQFVLSCEATSHRLEYLPNNRRFVLTISSIRIDMDITLAVLATLPDPRRIRNGYERRDPLPDKEIVTLLRTDPNKKNGNSRVFNPMLHRFVSDHRNKIVFIEQQLVAHSQQRRNGECSQCTDTGATDFKDDTFQYITNQPRIGTPEYDEFTRAQKTPKPILFD